MMRLALVAAVIIKVAMGVPAHAHEVRPGYLEIRQTETETFDVLWKVPARGRLKLAIYARLPDNCVPLSAVVSTKGGGAFTDRWTVTCPGGLSGGTIVIDGLSGTLTDVLARIERLDGSSQVFRLSPDAPVIVIEATPGWQQIAGTYLGLGVEHILSGIDHLLFVLALLLLVKGWRRLVATVTAFTVAHSLTLAAATLGFVHVPQRPIEAVIALSIAFVAAELVRLKSGQVSLTQRWPWAIAFIFGLLHGFGFAGALSEIGLPEQAIPLALLFFNIGVELGQLLFIAGVVAIGTIARRIAVPLPAWAPQLSAYAIGTVAAFWTIERVARF
ncbi:MAG: HupE/UreJ family protein [Woeseiaceae bacterium]